MINEYRSFISLLSDGFDSPVASYLMIKRGFTPNFITFITSDVKVKEFKEKILSIARNITRPIEEQVSLYFINHVVNLTEIQQKCERKLTCILCKRLMIRIAKKLATEKNIKNIVTGDILGEQASQTLDNLYSYNDVITDFVLLRPLIAWDKLEVINISRKIGVYEICCEKIVSCGFTPEYPETHARIKEVMREEDNLKIDELISRSLENKEEIII